MDVKKYRLSYEEVMRIKSVSYLVYEIMDEQLDGCTINEVIAVTSNVLAAWCFNLDELSTDEICRVFNANFKIFYNAFLLKGRDLNNN